MCSRRRKEIFYFDDSGSLNAFRYGDWKVTWCEAGAAITAVDATHRREFDCVQSSFLQLRPLSRPLLAKAI
jgi:hypothetical protein